MGIQVGHWLFGLVVHQRNRTVVQGKSDQFGFHADLGDVIRETETPQAFLDDYARGVADIEEIQRGTTAGRKGVVVKTHVFDRRGGEKAWVC